MRLHHAKQEDTEASSAGKTEDLSDGAPLLLELSIHPSGFTVNLRPGVLPGATASRALPAGPWCCTSFDLAEDADEFSAQRGAALSAICVKQLLEVRPKSLSYRKR